METEKIPRWRKKAPGGIRATRVVKRRARPANVPVLPELVRRGAVVALVAGVALLIPPVRKGLAVARDVVKDAVAEGRRAEQRRVIIARYAREYGISPELAAQIERAAWLEGIDPELAFRVVDVESDFKPEAVSPVGALGLVQLMPATARSLQPGITRREILDPQTNLRLGFHYLRELLDIYDGDVDEALHAYNRGPGTVARLRRQGRDPANGYAEKVLRLAGKRRYTGSGLAE